MMGSNQRREYEVLYFKRKNKVHKSKGVSKMDGRLVQNDGSLRLYEGGNTDKGNRENTKEPIPIYSLQNLDLSKRIFQVDDELTLGQYSLEIVSAPTIDTAKENVGKSRLLETRTRTICSISKGGIATTARLPLMSRKLSAPRAIQKRRPPVQPKQAIETSSDSDDNHVIKEKLLLSLKPELLKQGEAIQKRRSPQLSGQKRKLESVPSTGWLHQPPPTNAIGSMVLPPSLRDSMRPHQHSGVSFIWNCLTGASPQLRKVAEQAGLQETPKGAILADSMGMGKTLITVAVVVALYRRNKQHRFIIVCPSSLVQNWAKEFDKWLGKASLPKRVVVKKGGPDGLQLIRSFVATKPNQSEILIVSYDLFRINVTLLADSKQIGLLVVDEGHRLKNSSGSLTVDALNSLTCEARLLITGTPIQNNLSEFHAVANFVCPGILGLLADFRREFERPIIAANRKDATRDQRQWGAERSKTLDEIIKTFLVRRLAKDVLKDLLPPRTELLLFCRPSLAQCELYRKITSNILDPLSALTKLRKLCSHPDLLTQTESLSSSSGVIADSGKLQVLEALLTAIRLINPGDKVVVVSGYTSVLTMIETKLVKAKAWGYKRLDGRTAQCNRQSLVDAFNRLPADQCFLFLLSSRAGGMGLNLIGANRLVMFDADFNPAIDAQTMARIYRSGQTKPTYIYRLFTAGTMEEIVFQRQQQKGNLASVTVDGSFNDESGKFTSEELRDCFTLKDTRCDTKIKMKSNWPEYDGRQSLSCQGCSDLPMLNVASECFDILGHVHIVPTESNAASEHLDPFMEIDETSIEQDEHELPIESSDEGEYEFEG